MKSEQLYNSQRKRELVGVAEAMLDGQLHLIEGVRTIIALSSGSGHPDDEIFMPIRAIDSETDHLPVGVMRQHCASEYLEKADREAERYLDGAREDILAACRKIVSKYSKPSVP